MKPDWDKLMEMYAGSATDVVGDVDCTAAESKALCERIGVEGYPTIKWGDPSKDLDKYPLSRKWDDILKFATENLGPVPPKCGPDHIDLCNPGDKATIDKFSAMSDEDLDAYLQVAADKISKAEKDFEELGENVEKSQNDRIAANDALKKEIKDASYAIAKQVRVPRRKVIVEKWLKCGAIGAKAWKASKVRSTAGMKRTLQAIINR